MCMMKKMIVYIADEDLHKIITMQMMLDTQNVDDWYKRVIATAWKIMWICLAILSAVTHHNNPSKNPVEKEYSEKT